MKYRYYLIDADLGNIVMQFNDLDILNHIDLCISYFIRDNETYQTIKTFRYSFDKELK